MQPIIKEIISREFDNNSSKFARHCGFSPQQVNQWLKGRNNPSHEAWEKMSASLSYSIENLKAGTVYELPPMKGSPEATLADLERNLQRTVSEICNGRVPNFEDLPSWYFKLKPIFADKNPEIIDLAIESLKSTIGLLQANKK